NGGVDGIAAGNSVAVSPDGANVYVASLDSAVAVFSRAPDGVLSFEQVVRDGDTGIEGLDGARSVTVSPDGRHAYVGSILGGAIVAFARAPNGMLTLEQVVREGENGVQGIGGPIDISVSPNGANVYVGNDDGAVAVFAVTDVAAPIPADSFEPDDGVEQAAP